MVSFIILTGKDIRMEILKKDLEEVLRKEMNENDQ
jgi:hypothetical protein